MEFTYFGFFCFSFRYSLSHCVCPSLAFRTDGAKMSGIIIIRSKMKSSRTIEPKDKNSFLFSCFSIACSVLSARLSSLCGQLVGACGGEQKPYESPFQLFHFSLSSNRKFVSASLSRQRGAGGGGGERVIEANSFLFFRSH